MKEGLYIPNEDSNFEEYWQKFERGEWELKQQSMSKKELSRFFYEVGYAERDLK